MKFGVLTTVVGLLSCILTAGPATGEEKATKEEAQAMVKKAITFIQQVGRRSRVQGNHRQDRKIQQSAISTWWSISSTAKCWLMAPMTKLVGKDMSDAQDVDGKYFVKERIELARKQATFWQDYKFVNPVTRKIELKEMYCERLGEAAVCAGIYKN